MPHGFEHTAFRLELQRQYVEPVEAATVARFTSGDPQDPTELPEFAAFFDLIRGHVAAGRRFGRVRVHDEPPTPYQQWERWIGRWNTEAGESIRYLTRRRAQAIGLLPAVGVDDWWLLDAARLLVMKFDEEGHRLGTQLVTDPRRIAQACAWRDLAVHHSAPDTPGDVAA